LPRKGYRFIFPITPQPSPELEVVAPAQPARSSNRFWLIGGAAVLLIGLAILVITHFVQTKASSGSQNLNIVPLTSYPGAELYPSFSPDGNEIAFAWNGSEAGVGFDLYRKQIGSEQAVRLTNAPARALAPAWSPDGRFIAFSRATPDGSSVYLIP